MGLYQDWIKFAEEKQKAPDAQKYWNQYFATEKEIYAKILKEKPESNTVKGYADLFSVDIMTMVGFLDGINDSLKTANPMDELLEETEVNLNYDNELLYKNMVGAKADWLYNLGEWDEILTVEKREALYKEQKLSTTVRKENKTGRNDPCPCGSGKKYKKCCGRN